MRRWGIPRAGKREPNGEEGGHHGGGEYAKDGGGRMPMWGIGDAKGRRGRSQGDRRKTLRWEREVLREGIGGRPLRKGEGVRARKGTR